MHQLVVGLHGVDRSNWVFGSVLRRSFVVGCSHGTLREELVLLSVHQVLHTFLLKKADLVFFAVGRVVPGVAVSLA